MTSPHFARLTLAALVLAVPSAALAAQIGTPFSPPKLVNAAGAGDGTTDDSVNIRFDAFARLLVVHRAIDPDDGDSDIHFAKSRDRGVTWTTSVPALNLMATDTADDVDPVLFVDTVSSALIYATDRFQTPGEHDIAWGASSGEPSSFSNNGFVNSDFNTDVGEDRLPCAATGNGMTVCIWQRTVAGESDLCFSRKLSSGPTWTSVAFLNTNAASDSGLDRNPRVATDGNSKWIAVWDSTTDLPGDSGGDTDILFSRSTNNGMTWSAPQILNSTATTDGAAIDQFPVVAADPATGEFLVAWISDNSLGGSIGTDRDILWARSTDSGVTWSAAAALNHDAAGDESSGFSNDIFPDLVADGRGGFVCVWQRGDVPFTESDLLGARFDLSGGAWTSHVTVNTNAATDVGGDFRPMVTFSHEGHGAVAWSSSDDLGGTIGTDFDVLSTRFEIPLSANPGTKLCVGFREDGLPRCPCGNDIAPTLEALGCANSTGLGGGIQLSGTASLAAPTASLLGYSMPPNSSALYFQGTASANFGAGSSFGDGLRCVSGTIVRIGTATNSGGGQSTRALPATGLASGDVRIYQVWYRNAVDFCTSATFNLTGAIALTWEL